MNFESLAIHAGQEPDPLTGAVSVPIYQTSTYKQDGIDELRGGNDYARTTNPTRTALQECMAALEGGRHGIAFASGMAATQAVLASFAPGSRVLGMNDVYGGTYRLFERVLRDQGYRFSYADLADADALETALARGIDLVWAETPTNPLLKVVDIAALAERTHAAGALLCIDNTFASPYLQQPLKHGADFVVESTTKYIGGHSDVIGGMLVLDDDTRAERLRFLQNAIGGVPGPQDCFLTLRGVKTLAVRMRAHCENARAVADYLASHDAATAIYYPGLPDHPGHAAAARQMRDFGGMVSFSLRGGPPAVYAALREAGIWTLGESLGGVESLVEYPRTMTHAALAGSGFEVPDDLIRLSVGIEHIDDLLADLERMLAAGDRAAATADVLR